MPLYGSSREILEAIMKMTMIHVEMLDVLCSQEILVKCSVISHCTRIHGVIFMNTLLHFIPKILTGGTRT